MYKLTLLALLQMSDYKVGEIVCKYDAGTHHVIQIKDKDGRCIEEIISDIKYRKVLEYRHGQACGFCGDYTKLKGKSIDKYIRDNQRFK